jgi:hypothetical protein
MFLLHRTTKNRSSPYINMNNCTFRISSSCIDVNQYSYYCEYVLILVNKWFKTQDFARLKYESSGCDRVYVHVYNDTCTRTWLMYVRMYRFIYVQAHTCASHVCVHVSLYTCTNSNAHGVNSNAHAAFVARMRILGWWEGTFMCWWHLHSMNILTHNTHTHLHPCTYSASVRMCSFWRRNEFLLESVLLEQY